MAELLIVRHGEPTLSGVFLGALDPSLSEEGRRQAARLVIDENWPVYVSPMLRAAETAAALGRPMIYVEDFREIGYGSWEGLTWAEIEARYPEEARLKTSDWFGHTVAGAESWEGFRARVATGLRRIKTPAIVVAHLGVNSVLREATTGEAAVSFQQGYCEIVRLAW